MVETIRWMVVREQEPRRREILLKVLVLFLIGGLVGGAVGGLLLAGVSVALRAVPGGPLPGFLIVSIGAAIAYGGNRLGWWSVPVPQFRHQVPQAWRDVFPSGVASFIYAGALGVTYFTRISSMAFYAFVPLLISLSSPTVIVVLFALSGLVRASTALLVPLLGTGRSQLDVAPSLDRSLNLISHAEGFFLLATAVVLGVYGLSLVP